MNVCKQISFGAVEISGRQINEIAMEEKYYECATSFLIQLAQNHEAHPEENYEEIYQQTKNKISKKVLHNTILMSLNLKCIVLEHCLSSPARANRSVLSNL